MPHSNLFRLICLTCCLLVAAGTTAQTVISQRGEHAPQEQDPLLRADGKVLFFTRVGYAANKGTDNANDIWTMSRYADGSWGRALNPGSPINSFAHDRALGLSPDGSRLAVLRLGTTNYIDLLETSGRNWRITGSWPLPADVGPRYDLTFDLNANEVIYSTYDDGSLDLFRRRALPSGEWSAPTPLKEVNGGGNESNPALAPDGRTLYFQRDGGRWFRQDSREQRPLALALASSVRQFSPSLLASELVATLPGTGAQPTYLQIVPVAAEALPLPVEIYRGYLPTAPPPGQVTANVRLIDGQSLPVVPDALNRYAVFLRAGENIAGAANAGLDNGTGNGLATTGLISSVAADRKRLQAGIDSRQRELDRLDAERRKYDLVAPKTEDPELAALHDKYRRTTAALGDTLPPRSSVKSAERDRRYAAELAELERMKEKFRRQQNERLDQRSGAAHSWSEKSAETPMATKQPTTYSTPGTPLRPYLSPVEKARLRQDSLRIAAEVRHGLQRDISPKPYQRQPERNSTKQSVPLTTSRSPEKAAALDEAYQRQLAEIEALRAKLRNLEGMSSPGQTPAATPTTPSPQSVDAQWTARSPYQQAATPSPPAASGQPEARTTGATRLPGAPMPAGISFIPNTAYPDTRGYTGLDQLERLVRQSTTGLVEIRVHTPTELNPRAAQLLSEERATTIRNFLLNKGIATEQFKVIGFGNNLTGPQGERVEVVIR